MHMYAHNLLWFPLDYVDILFKYLPCFFFFSMWAFLHRIAGTELCIVRDSCAEPLQTCI